MANDNFIEELKQRRAEEYQMQLFGSHSRTVNAAIKHRVNDSLDSLCENLGTSLNKKFKFDDNGKDTLKKCISQLNNKYRTNMQPHLESLQSLVNKLICVPSNVLLNEDKCQEVQYTDEEFRELERKLDNLHQQAKRVTIYNAALKDEDSMTERNKESEDLAKTFFTHIKQSLSTTKLSSQTVQVIEKRNSLEESINALKPKSQKEIYNPQIDNFDIESI